MSSATVSVFWIVCYGLAIGAMLGFAYDLLRIRRIALAKTASYGKQMDPCPLTAWHFPPIARPERQPLQTVLLCIEDLLFCACSGAVVSVMIFYALHGRIRAYALLCCAAGFLLYRKTVGRLTVRLASRVIAVLRRIARWLLAVTVHPLLRLTKRTLRGLGLWIRYALAKRKTKRYFDRLPKRMLPLSKTQLIKERKKKERRMPHDGKKV